MTNENEYTYRHIDEANIKRAETERILRMRELDIAEHSNSIYKISLIIWFAISLILLIITVALMLSEGTEDMPGFARGMLFMFFACAPIIGGGAYVVFGVIPRSERRKEVQRNGGIQFPKSLEPFNQKGYWGTFQVLQSVGFTNVTCINLHDCVYSNDPGLDWIQNLGKVESISVNGKKIQYGGEYYYPNADIKILYHGR